MVIVASQCSGELSRSNDKVHKCERLAGECILSAKTYPGTSKYTGETQDRIQYQALTSFDRYRVVIQIQSVQ